MGIKLKRTDVISIILFIISFLLILYLVYYYQTHSPEVAYATHQDLWTITIYLGGSMFTAFLGILYKFIGFAKELGELKGTLNQFIKNYKPKKRKK